MASLASFDPIIIITETKITLLMMILVMRMMTMMMVTRAEVGRLVDRWDGHGRA